MSTKHIQSLLRQARKLSPDERTELIRDLQDSLTTDREAPHSPVEANEEISRTDYVALFGSGRGGFANAKTADEFIREERDSWDN